MLIRVRAAWCRLLRMRLLRTRQSFTPCADYMQAFPEQPSPQSSLSEWLRIA